VNTIHPFDECLTHSSTLELETNSISNIHDIPYIITFIVLHNSVVNSSYSMLLGRQWVRYAKVAHDWGSNIVTIHSRGTITITKCLGGEVRRPKVLLCYNYQNGITNEEDIIFVIELKLFSRGTINLP